MNNQKNILIVEDEPFISDLYIRALTNANYRATVINDGQKALDEIRKNSYDIILLDIMLPNLTGTDILHSLKQDLSAKSSKIIVATNLELPPEERSQIEAIVDGYVIKAEITPKELVDLLDKYQV